MRRPTTPLALATTLCSLAFGATSASAAAPTIPLTTFSHVTTDSASLEADVNPQGKATLYRFEYGPADCSSNPCASIPVPEGKLSPGGTAVRVSALLEGLTPGSLYHFRAIAKSPEGTTKGPDRTFATYSSPPLFGPCPNDEPFRNQHPSANLPDCRAYEQSSPVNKNGLDALGSYPTVRASLDGNRISFGTANGIPGGVGAQEVPLYLASRGAGAWSTQGMLPPETYGARSQISGWTQDFSQVFAKAQTFDEAPVGTFLSRSSADGSVSLITSYQEAGLIDPNYAGASADGSKVFFEETFQLLPEAAAGKNNLYVWDRESEEISLVGILPDGSAAPNGSFAGPYDWVKGTDADSLGKGGAQLRYYTQDLHAISADGNRVYFTAAGSGQLYLRLNPSEEQSPLDGKGKCTNPTLACTIQVSANQRSGGDPLGARPAAFMAAAPDGSAAIFTSPEELTDDANTGPEPPPGGITRADIDGKNPDPGFLAARGSGIAVDGSHIYWADPGAGTIGRAKIGASEAEEIEPNFIGGAGKPQYVAVDSEHVYWTNAVEEKEGEGKGTIGRAEIDGKNPNPNFIAGASNPRGIDVNATNVYWANAGTHSIGRAKIDGKDPVLKWRDPGFGDIPQGVALSPTHVYWTVNNPHGFVSRIDFEQSEAEKFRGIGEAAELKGIAIDGGHVYWVARGQKAIGRIDLELSEASRETEFIKAEGDLKGLAVDASHIYWTVNGDVLPNPGNDLYRYDADTSQLTDLAPDGAEVNGAEVRGVLGASADGSYVYFVANGVLSATPNAAGESATPGNCPVAVDAASGACNLYLVHEGAIEFIARLALGDEPHTDAANWTATPLSGFPETIRFQRTARVSADGQTLLFRSQRQLSAYDNEGQPQLYRFHLGDVGLICVSCNPSSEAPVSAQAKSILTPVLVTTAPASTLSRSLSADGNRVFFESTDPLVGADTNGEAGCPIVGTDNQSFPACQDVYEWEANGSGTCESESENGGCLYLLSTGKSPDPSFFADASPSGGDAFIFTRSQLVGQDRDQLIDVYDARTEGGLQSQNEAEPPICENEGCKGPPTPPPSAQSPGSSSFSGPGNVNEGRKPGCAKGKRRVKGRCRAKRHTHKHRKPQRRNANASGRTSR